MAAKGKEIVWRGRAAWYDHVELDTMKEFSQRLAALEPGEERSALMAEIDVIHELKATFAARMLTDDEAAYFTTEGEAVSEQELSSELGELPGPDSPFQIPQGVRERLEARRSETPVESELDEVVEPEQFSLEQASLPLLPEGRPGRYSGAAPTATEKASGDVIEAANLGPLRRGGAGHRVLRVFRPGERLTSYDASFRAAGDYHSKRREATRLTERGLLVKDGEMSNPSPGGRERVDAYRLTAAGAAELERLNGGSDA